MDDVGHRRQRNLATDDILAKHDRQAIRRLGLLDELDLEVGAVAVVAVREISQQAMRDLDVFHRRPRHYFVQTRPDVCNRLQVAVAFDLHLALCSLGIAAHRFATQQVKAVIAGIAEPDNALARIDAPGFEPGCQLFELRIVEQLEASHAPQYAVIECRRIVWHWQSPASHGFVTRLGTHIGALSAGSGRT